MFYRLGGVYHTRYETDLNVLHYRFDKIQVGLVVLAAVTAPFWLSHIYLMGYILPWIVWGTAALSLNLLELLDEHLLLVDGSPRNTKGPQSAKCDCFLCESFCSPRGLPIASRGSQMSRESCGN